MVLCITCFTWVFGVFWGFFLITVFIIVNSITSITSIVIMFYFVSIIKLFLTHELWWGGFLEGRDWLLGWFSFLFNFFFSYSPPHPIVGALGRK